MFYTLTLAAHNVMRWVILVLAIYALYRVFAGLFGKREWTEADRKALSFYSIGMDIQLLLGLLLYFVFGGWFGMVTSDTAAVMSNSNMRFFAVEHIAVMVVAVILAHVAVVTAKRAATSAGKFRNGAIFVTLSVLAVLFAIPWATRPLVPVFSAILAFFA